MGRPDVLKASFFDLSSLSLRRESLTTSKEDPAGVPHRAARAARQLQGNAIPKPNYSFAKRQRELEKERKKAEKIRKKAAGPAPAPDAPEVQPPKQQDALPPS
jgi:hypothetical protein